MKKRYIKTGEVVVVLGECKVEWNAEDYLERKLTHITEGTIWFNGIECHTDSDGPYIELEDDQYVNEYGDICTVSGGEGDS